MFSDKTISALVARPTKYFVFEGGSDPGFCIRVMPTGTKVFYQQYTLHGKRRFLKLGTWPDMPLNLARRRARQAREKIDAGEDPQGAPKPKRQDQTGSAAALMEAFIAHQIEVGRRQAANVRAAIEKDAIPIIGTLRAREVGPAHIRQILYRTLQRGSEVQANRLRSYLHTMFRFAMHHDNDPRSLGAAVLFGVAANPVEAVPKNAAAESVGERVLSWEDLAAVWHGNGLPQPYPLMLRLIIATGGQRPVEVIGAAWAEIDGDRWTVPAERSKNSREHLIPVTPLMRAILDDIAALFGESAWLFPARLSVRSGRPMQRQSLSRAIQEWAHGLEKWTPRDLRRTCKTLMGEIGVDKFTRDRLQNHSIADVSGRHYDRWSYKNEKRAALEAWSAALQARGIRHTPFRPDS